MSDRKKLRKDKIGCAIIGAGRIAASFDNSRSREVLTHAHAYTKNKETRLLGFFDINKKNCLAAARKWSCRAFNSLEEMFSEDPQIISICTPDNVHAKTLLSLIKYRPRLVICEKPVTGSLKDTKKVARLYAKNKIPVMINYSYRFDPSIREIKKDIESGIYGKAIFASGIYTKGILHNGTHLVDICRFLFGEAKRTTVLGSRECVVPNDKNISAFLAFDKCDQFYLMAGDETKISIFEIDILFESKRVVITDSGYKKISYNAVKDSRYKNYTVLGKPVFKSTGLNNAMAYLVERAVRFIELGGGQLISDIHNAVETQKLCGKLLMDKRKLK